MKRILVLEERIPDLLARVSEIEIRLKVFRWKAFLPKNFPLAIQSRR